MKELIRFRQFLTEAMAPTIEDLQAKVSGNWASDVLQSGYFGTVNPFGNGEKETPLMNITQEIRDNFKFYSKNPDTDEFDLVQDDMEAVGEIAQAVKELGGRVAYGGGGLQYVYTVNDQGDLLGQAIATDEEIGGNSSKEWSPKGFAFIFRTNAQGKEQFEQAKSILQNQGIPFEEDSEMNGEIALNFSGTQDVRDLKQILGNNGVGRYTIGSINQYK